MDDVTVDAARPEPSGDPEAITASLIHHRDARDRAAGLYCFVPPPMPPSPQHLRIRIQLSQRAPVDAGNATSNQPTRQAHFDAISMTAIRVVFSLRATGDLLRSFGFGMVGTPSVLSDDDGASPSPPAP
jgi:hypothetical protein